MLREGGCGFEDIKCWVCSGYIQGVAMHEGGGIWSGKKKEEEGKGVVCLVHN